MTNSSPTFAPGQRLEIRDAEWLVRKVDRSSSGGQIIHAVGLSDIVRDREAVFLTELEPRINRVDPLNTRFVRDPSPGYADSILYMESLLRQAPPTTRDLAVGDRAVMDVLPFQLEPAAKALANPRRRILIADGVGLGKTLEAGILIAELIRRGQGRRILAVTVKSMMTQFQKELWSRFTIPLFRLDSAAIQRVRTRIPTNHNPFYYFDKTIISIDTLKNDMEYRSHLEKAWWDIIVIDEAHNVAVRGDKKSQRARLAQLLAGRSDTLIMLSATPHDGKAASFASLMNMLDPTAIADENNYCRDDIKGLFCRRFKKDIIHQVRTAFREREIFKARAPATDAEEYAFRLLANLVPGESRRSTAPGHLFRTTLEKALLSSPAACSKTIANRLGRVEGRGPTSPALLPGLTSREAGGEEALTDSTQDSGTATPSYRLRWEGVCDDDQDQPGFGEGPGTRDEETSALLALKTAVDTIDARHFGKYMKLLRLIRDPDHGFGWTGRDTGDRLLIFTERIDTLNFLADNLPHDLGLKADAVAVLHGGLPDGDQNRIVEEFGQDEKPVRLLLASDVASEGLNLHYLCHKLIHFDIPWSLMLFQQRNGRIDRYGQTRTPRIAYLLTETQHPKIGGDLRILELLIDKDQQAHKNIGDPAALMNVYDIDAETDITAAAIEQGLSADLFEIEHMQFTCDFLDALLGAASPAAGSGAPVNGPARDDVPATGSQAPCTTGSGGAAPDVPVTFRRPARLIAGDYQFLKMGLTRLQREQTIQFDADDNRRLLEFTAPASLQDRFRFLPPETLPENARFSLCADPDVVAREIEFSRKRENAWPRIQYLWELHPALKWLSDTIQARFSRNEAPVMILPPERFDPNTVVFILSGLIPNRRGQPLIHRWFGVRIASAVHSPSAPVVEPLEAIIALLSDPVTAGGAARFANSGRPVRTQTIGACLPAAVKAGCDFMRRTRTTEQETLDVALNHRLNALDDLKNRRLQHLETRLAASKRPDVFLQQQREREIRAIDTLFSRFFTWMEDTMTSEINDTVTVIAAIAGEGFEQ